VRSIHSVEFAFAFAWQGSETLYFVDEGEVQVELKGEAVKRYTAGQWFGEEALIGGANYPTSHTYRAVGCVHSHSKMPGAVVTRGAILFKISAHDIDLIAAHKLQRLRSITQAPFIRALNNSVSLRFPRGQMLVRKKMNCVVRRLSSYSKSVGNLADGEIFEILEELKDKEGTYHVRMKRKKGSASGPPIEGWVTATR
jgi:CRP-like cAMP-binding protein